MRAKDVMTTDPIVVGPQATVGEIAELLLQRRISGVPVVDAEGRVLGVVSEDDLLHRPETGGPRRRSRWLAMFSSRQASEFLKAHGRIAHDVMSAPAIVVDEDASLAEIAGLLEERRIKRVPVLRDGRLVGIVSRADLLRGIAAAKSAPPPAAVDDRSIREATLAAMKREGWPMAATVNVVVSDGVAHIWGLLDNDEDPRPLVLLVEGVPGVKAVEDHRGHVPFGYAYAL